MFGLLAGLLPTGVGAKLLGAGMLAAGVAVTVLLGRHWIDTRDAALKAAATQAQQLDQVAGDNGRLAAALKAQQDQAAQASAAAAAAADQTAAARATIAGLRVQIERARHAAGQDGPVAPVLRQAVQGAWDAIDARGLGLPAMPAAAGAGAK